MESDLIKRYSGHIHRLRKIVETQSHIIVGFIGVVSVLLSVLVAPLSDTLKSVLEALGAGLVAATVAAHIISRMWKSPSLNPDVITIELQADTPLHGGWVEQRGHAKEIDGLAILHQSLLQELAFNRSKERIMQIATGKKMRLLLLDPRSEYLVLRAKDIGATPSDLEKRCHNSIKYCFHIWAALSEHVRKGDQAYHGKFEVRLFDRPPGIWMYKYDDEILWGLMPSYKPIFESAVFRLSSASNNHVFNQFIAHFEELWRNGCSESNDENYLLKYSELGELVLNESLFEKLLGPDWRKDCESLSLSSSVPPQLELDSSSVKIVTS